jgi:hypothetical protein
MPAAALRSGAVGAEVTAGNATPALRDWADARLRLLPVEPRVETGLRGGGDGAGNHLAHRAATVPDALDLLTAPPPPATHKWIDRDDV